MGFKRGDTFHYGDSPSTRHLHIVICESTSPTEPLVVVSVNTVRGWTDTTMVLQVGDHPFIQWPSAVSYNWVRSIPLIVLQNAEAMSLKVAPGFRNFNHDVAISALLLDAVTHGALASPLTPRGMKQLISTLLGIPLPLPRQKTNLPTP